MKQVVLETPIHPDGIKVLDGQVEIVGPLPDQGQVLQALRDGAQALIVSMALKVTDAIMAAAPGLEVVGRPGIGVDSVDIDAATRHGVMVVNTPDGPTESTAEHAVALLLALAKRIQLGDTDIRQAGFANRGSHVGVEVFGKTLGLVGLGRIGKRVAEICALGLKMRVLGYDPYVSPQQVADLGVEMVSDLDTIIREADFLSLHTPLVPETEGLIGARELAMMKPTAFLINVARGPIVDEDALLETLRAGRIAGAGLDVYKEEPLPFPHPLLELENVVVTPHIASATTDGRRRMGTAVAEQVLIALQGEQPPFLVNPEVWAKRRALTGQR